MSALHGNPLPPGVTAWHPTWMAPLSGIFLLASWPNAAFDMCGMACGWLEMPFWTFFGATLLGKGVVKVTFQTLGCIVVFRPETWKSFLALLPQSSPVALQLRLKFTAVAITSVEGSSNRVAH